jgi:LDH2 family malate/lactate/ureidoglycolate dehydrogenase
VTVAAEVGLDPDGLVADVAAVFEAAGVPACDAHLVADSLVRAEMWGHPSHGLLRVGWYLDRIRAGTIRPAATADTIVDGGAIAVVDAKDGIGQVVAARAMDEAVRRARDHGVGVVSVRDSNHFGTAAYFTRGAAREGAIAVLVTNASPAMAPWGGRTKVLGANPWSVAAPAGRYGELVMDISNTAVARGKIYAAAERGEQVPPGWATDAEGRPTTDPIAAASGLILPMAEHKGYAISFVMDVLAGVLSGGVSGVEVHGPQQADRRSRCSHLALVFDVASFGPREAFDARMEALIEQAKGVPLASGADRILFPGEREAILEQSALERGVDVAPRSLDGLRSVAESSGVELRLGPHRANGPGRHRP